MSQNGRIEHHDSRIVEHPPRPFTLAEAKSTFEAILKRVNDPKNDIHNADFWALEQGQAAGDVSSAIKLDKPEVKKLTGELSTIAPGLRSLILEKVIPERMDGRIKDGIYLSKNGAADLTKYASAHGVHVKFESKKPVLPLADIQFPGSGPTVTPPSSSPIEGVVAIGEIKSSAPADPKVVARINEISSMVMAKEAGKGKNVLASVVNILDMIAPVAVSLL